MTHNANEISDSFFNHVKDALENIYDYPALQTHPFALQLGQEIVSSRDNPAHQLRKLLIDAIEKLNPGNHEGARIGTKRIYNLLHMHYVGGMTLQEVALELGVSVRQAYRDLKKGQDSVSSVLWFKFGQETDMPTSKETMNTLSSVQSELTQVEGDIHWVNMSELLKSISGALERLAEQVGVTIMLELAPESGISTNPMMARQVLMNLLSQAIQQNPVEVALQLEETEKHAILSMNYETVLENPIVTPVIEQLVQQLGWQIEQSPEATRIIMRRVDMSVLLIDDNKGLVDLMKRYLGDESYQVMTANNGHDGLKIAQDARPDVIVMDIMMPEMDGWELLQRLRMIPVTATIPIVVCSVINDPQLALTLGASKFVAKPVDKEKLYQALAELRI